MSEFKGTKGKWYHQIGTSSIWHSNIEGLRIAIVEDTFYRSSMTSEGKANALLISKAPEILEMLETVIKDYENIIPQSPARDNRIDQIKELIKSATEI